MKKILFAILVLISIQSFGQPTGYQKRIVNERIQGSFMVDSAFNMPRYYDTTAANLHKRSDSCGAIFYSYSDKTIWQRSCTPKRWVMIANGDNIQTIINNYIDSSFFNFNDSTLIFCSAPGACDTIHLGNSNTYYFNSTGDSIITCDTVQTITVGDSSYQQQICDTIPIPGFNITFYQNFLRKFGHLVEFGSSIEGNSMADLRHDTYAYTDYYRLKLHGRPIQKEVLQIENQQWVSESQTVLSLKHLGPADITAIDGNNRVKLYFNYTDPMRDDTTGYMKTRIGYMLNTNGGNGRYFLNVDNDASKQTGIMFHTLDTAVKDAVTIFGTQIPKNIRLYNNPGASTFLDDRIAIFKTTKQVQFPGYTVAGGFRVDDTTNYKPFVSDVSGNVYRFNHWPGGGGVNIYNSDGSIPDGVGRTVSIDGNFTTLVFNNTDIANTTANANINFTKTSDPTINITSESLTAGNSSTLRFRNGTLVFDDNRASPLGIQYLNNYASTYTIRTLVDKNYVDSSITAGGGSGVTSVGSGFGTNFSTITTTGSVVVDSTSGGVTSSVRTKKVIDSLQAAGWGSINITTNESWIQQWRDPKTTSPYVVTGGGVGGSVVGFTTSSFDGWLGGATYNTGTTSSSFIALYADVSGNLMPISFKSTKRYNYEEVIRFEDLSDGTETYNFMCGFSDGATQSTIVDGAFFSYTHSVSSGQWVCNTVNNSTPTATASGITVAADTDYQLDISVFGGNAYFYIDKVLVATISTNVPSGTTRLTSIVSGIEKQLGSTNRKAYSERQGFGKMNQ